MQISLNKELGSKIKQLREQQGITLTELSKMVNKDIGHLSRIENNKMNVSVRTVFDILKILGVKRLKLEVN